MLTDVPGMLTRAGLYPHSQPTAAVIHDKSVSHHFVLPPNFLVYRLSVCVCARNEPRSHEQHEHADSSTYTHTQ